MDFLPLMVRTLSVDTPLFHIDSHRQACEILWLTVAMVVILCRLVLRVTTQRQQPLLVRDPSHVLVARLDRGRTYVPVLGLVGSIGLGRWGLGAMRASERAVYFEFPGC